MANSHWTIRDLIAFFILAVFLIALMAPMADASARTSRRMMNSTQLRGIHQGMVTYANANRNYFAGLDSNGNDSAIWVEQRYQILLEGDYFTPEYAISPYETDTNIHEWNESGVVIQDNYSFAMLQLPADGYRRGEWKQTLNSQAVVVTDRNTGTELDTHGYRNDDWQSSTTMGCSHNHHQPYAQFNHWVGQVLWNDNHVEFIETDSPDTKYGPVPNTADNLFSSPGTDDALLIHTGN